MKKNHGKITALVILATIMLPVVLPVCVNVAKAATAGDQDYTLLAPLTCVESSTVTCGGNGSTVNSVNFRTYLQYMFNLMIALCAVAAVFMIVWGGLEYMLSSIPNVKTEGLARVKNAVTGLLLVLCSYLILRTIDPRFVSIPTTLVPTLELKGSLTAPANTKFLASLQEDVDNLEAENAAANQKNKEDLQSINERLRASQDRRTEIESTLYELCGGTNCDPYYGVDEDITNLLDEWSTLGNDISSAKVAKINKETAISYNERIADVFSKLKTDKVYAVGKVLELVEDGKSKIDDDFNLGTSRLANMGQNNLSNIQEQSYYAKGQLDILGANKLIDDLYHQKSSSVKITGEETDGYTIAANLQAQGSDTDKIKTILQEAADMASNLKNGSREKSDLLDKIETATVKLDQISKAKVQ